MGMVRQGAMVAGVGVMAALLAAISMRATTTPQVESAGEESVAAAVPGEVCRVVTATSLPAELAETSGLARAASGLLWSHNDAGNEAILYALDSAGALAARVRLPGVSAVDWEDIGSGRCPEGSCLFVADTGDNEGGRASVTVYRLPEPAASATQTSAVALSARFPAVPMDIEAMFVTPQGEVYLVTKGRSSPIVLYRMPATQGSATGTLELVAQLAAEPANDRDRVTGASADPSGRWVALRTYGTLQIHMLATLLSGASRPVLTFDLTAMGEAQGEGVAIESDGTVWLSSEAGGKKAGPRLTRLSCALPK